MTGKQPDGAVIYKRSQYFALARSAARYLSHGTDADRWIDFFKNARVPDEHWTVTVQYAQPGGPQGNLPLPVGTLWHPDCITSPQAAGRSRWHPCQLGMLELTKIRAMDSIFTRKVEMDQAELKAALVNGEPKMLEFDVAGETSK
jgi:hypothetical protein